MWHTDGVRVIHLSVGSATASASPGMGTGRAAQLEACVKPTWVLL